MSRSRKYNHRMLHRKFYQKGINYKKLGICCDNNVQLEIKDKMCSDNCGQTGNRRWTNGSLQDCPEIRTVTDSDVTATAAMSAMTLEDSWQGSFKFQLIITQINIVTTKCPST